MYPLDVVLFVCVRCFFVVLDDTATTEIYTYLHTRSLHDALPIWSRWATRPCSSGPRATSGSRPTSGRPASTPSPTRSSARWGHGSSAATSTRPTSLEHSAVAYSSARRRDDRRSCPVSVVATPAHVDETRAEEPTSGLQSLMSNSSV